MVQEAQKFNLINATMEIKRRDVCKSVTEFEWMQNFLFFFSFEINENCFHSNCIFFVTITLALISNSVVSSFFTFFYYFCGNCSMLLVCFYIITIRSYYIISHTTYSIFFFFGFCVLWARYILLQVYLHIRQSKQTVTNGILFKCLLLLKFLFFSSSSFAFIIL